MAHWTQAADAEDKPAFWRRVDGVIVRASVAIEDNRPLWEIVFPTGRKGTLPSSATLKGVLAKIDQDNPLPSWAFGPGLSNQKGHVRSQGSDCELVAGAILEVPGEENSLEGEITLQLRDAGGIMRLHPDGRVVIEGTPVSTDDLWYYQRFKPWLRANAERLTNGTFKKEIVLTPGAAASAPEPGQPTGSNGSFVFRMENGLEILRFRYDGGILIAGSSMPTAGAKTALAAFHVWLSACSVISQPRQSR